MVMKFIQDFIKNYSKKPWASFEITEFEQDGRVKVECNWNKAFIEKIYSLGFQAETEQDSVQLFFYTSQLRPTELDGEIETATSIEHPNLKT